MFAYTLSLTFWLLRLSLVFKDSIYQVNIKLHKILKYYIACCVIICFVVLLTSWILAISSNNGYINTYCVRKLNIIDFIPYMYSDKIENSNDELITLTYNYKLNNFFSCDIKHGIISS